MTDFIHWTSEMYEAYMAKRKEDEEKQVEPFEGPESELQAKIERYLDTLGYYYFHDRSRGKNKPGHPDLVIACPKSRVVWMELKKRGGRLSLEQIQTVLKLMYLGQEIYVVKSFKQAVNIIHKND